MQWAADTVSCSKAHQLCKGLDLCTQDDIAVKQLPRTKLPTQILSKAEFLCIAQRHLLLDFSTGTSGVPQRSNCPFVARCRDPDHAANHMLRNSCCKGRSVRHALHARVPDLDLNTGCRTHIDYAV